MLDLIWHLFFIFVKPFLRAKYYFLVVNKYTHFNILKTKSTNFELDIGIKI